MHSGHFRGLKFGLITIALVAAQTLIVACSPAKWHETQKQDRATTFTGDPVAERQRQPTRPDQLRPGQTVTIGSNRVCGVRQPGSKPCKPGDVVFEEGDTCEVTEVDGEGGSLGCVPKDMNRPNVPKKPVHIPIPYVCPDPTGPTVDQLNAKRYFVVENIASSKTRVYERLSDCKNRLMFELDILIGENGDGTRTRLGSFTLTQWFKFHGDDKYPAFFALGYPELPKKGSGLNVWTSKSLLPEGQGVLRGAYGWYSAKLEPNAGRQWIHGSLGWGSDGQEFMQALKHGEKPVFSSRGATHVENQAISMMREILVPGTKVIRIYAREKSLAPSIEDSGTNQWPWILTNERGENAPRSGKVGVESRANSARRLDEGSYRFKGTATPIENGNAYGIDESKFQGFFLVDTGRVMGYEHPEGLAVGGHSDRQLPSVLLVSPRCQGGRPTQPPPLKPNTRPRPELPPEEPPTQEPPAEEPPSELPPLIPNPGGEVPVVPGQPEPKTLD